MRARPAVATIKFNYKREKKHKKHKKKILKTIKKNDETGHAIDFENTQIIAEEKHTGKG